MAPKKKPNRTSNNHQPSEPGLVSQTNLDNENPDSCKNHKLNGHISTGKQIVEDNGVHINGCNGTHLSDSSESSSSNIHTSSPEECTNLNSDSTVEVIGASLNRLTVGSGPSDPPSEDSGENVTNPSASSLVKKVTYVQYQSELQMPDIMRLIQKDLSEPYSIYTYRYFIHNWPMLCFLAMYGEKCVGAIVCKLDVHKKVVRRGYIAMLAVDEKYRQEKIGSNLVMKAIAAMVADGADEVVLETEITNEPALRLYENLGFVRDKRLFRYYLNGVDALRLKLWLR
uniref:N-terminal methionine N(alpha)-acetyltransferase NatC n=1 Tax=Daphnia longispina TaxID=42846 RepID=A0A4Y7M973_9CRUS|nr:EOG090X07BN [Daphnia longispina]